MKIAKCLTLVLVAGIPFAVVCSAPPQNDSSVHVLFGVGNPEKGIFPSNIFTVADETQKTGLRVNLPRPDCSVRIADCKDLALINVLDGFNLQPRVTVPFDGDIDPESVNSADAFFIELGDADIDAPTSGTGNATPRVIGVNQLVWDSPSHVLAAESDEQLRQHTRYAFVVTTGMLDASSLPIAPAEELTRSARLSQGYAGRTQDVTKTGDLGGAGRRPQRFYNAERDRGSRACSRRSQGCN